MKTTTELIPGVLTGIKARSTKDTPPITPPTLPGKAEKQHPNFSDWKTHGEDSLESALATAMRFTADVIGSGALYDMPGYTLTFCGVSGTGKTMLANCILNELERDKWGLFRRVKGYFVNGKMVNSTSMKRDWRKVSDGFKEGKFGILDDMEQTFLLMLDDIGADYDPSSMGISKLDRVLRARTGKWTILTCNLTLSQIAENLDTRIASFLIRDENKVVEIKAVDYALRKL